MPLFHKLCHVGKVLTGTRGGRGNTYEWQRPHTCQVTVHLSLYSVCHGAWFQVKEARTATVQGPRFLVMTTEWPAKAFMERLNNQIEFDLIGGVRRSAWISVHVQVALLCSLN